MTTLASCQAGRMGFRHAWDLDIPICFRPETTMIAAVDMRNDRCIHCELVRAVLWDGDFNYVMRYDYKTGIKYEKPEDRPSAELIQSWLRNKINEERKARQKSRRRAKIGQAAAA